MQDGPNTPHRAGMSPSGGNDLSRVRDPQAWRRLSVDALHALVADAAATLALLQATLVAKILEGEPASVTGGGPDSPAGDQLLTLRQAREALQLSHLPTDLPRVHLSRKCVRISARDLQVYIKQHRAPSTSSPLHCEIPNQYRPAHDGRRTPRHTPAAPPDAVGPGGKDRSPLELRRPLGTGRGRHLRADRPVGARAREATSPPSKGAIDGKDSEG